MTCGKKKIEWFRLKINKIAVFLIKKNRDETWLHLPQSYHSLPCLSVPPSIKHVEGQWIVGVTSMWKGNGWTSTNRHIHNTPPWMSIKDMPHWNLTKKKPNGKKSQWRKKSTTFFCVIICLVKNLTRKTQWDKTMVKGKRVQNTFLSPPHKDNEEV